MVCSPSTKAHVDKMYLCRIKSNGTSKSQTRGLQTRLYETSTKLGGNATQIKWGIYCTQERIYTFRGLCHSELSTPPYLLSDSFIFPYLPLFVRLALSLDLLARCIYHVWRSVRVSIPRKLNTAREKFKVI